MAITPQEALQRTIEHREIFHDEMLSLMRQIMAGELSPVMSAAIITGLRVKKETIGEITAAAQVMRELATRVWVQGDDNFVDIVGTGGDASHTFNISTARCSSRRRPARRLRSTATAASRRSRAAPTCSRRSASTSC
jgi:anthranilate phosphoribosyltransferase